MRFLMLLILPLTILGGELSIHEQLAKDVFEDDYDIRENATNKLGELGEDKLQWLVDKHMASLKTPDASMRFYSAAQKVFNRTAVYKTAEYRAFRAWIGMVCSTIYEPSDMENLPVPFAADARTTGMELVERITPGSPAEGKFKEGDVIEFIKDDGAFVKPPIKLLLADEEITYQVRRYKDPKSATTVQGDGRVLTFLNINNKDFEYVDICIKVGWKEDFNKETDERIRERRWTVFLGTSSTKKE